MGVTQINTPEVHDGTIYDDQVNSAANIAGPKIRQATTSARGTVILAGESGTSGVVEGNDPRLHTQNTDTGTTAKSYTINSSPVVGDNTELVLQSAVSGAGGSLRYNDTYNRVEYSNNYNGAKAYHILASLEDLGRGIMFRTSKLGSEYDTGVTGISGISGAPGTIYSLENGYFSVDGLKLLVFVNGDLKGVEAGDYEIISDTQIQFLSARNSNDVILILVYADIIYRISMLGSQALNVGRTQFQTPGVTLMSDTQSVMVFVDGSIKSAYMPTGVTPDFIFLNANTIQFVAGLGLDDRVDIIVVSMGVLLDVMAQLAGVYPNTFRIGKGSNDMDTISLLLGNGITQDIGARSYAGRLQVRELNKPWTYLWDLASLGLPTGTSGYVLEYDPTQINNVNWIDPRTLPVFPDGTDSYILARDSNQSPQPVKWIPQPIWQSVIPAGTSGWFLMYDPSVVGSMRWVDLNAWLRGWSGWAYINVSGTSGGSGYSDFLSVAEKILVVDYRQPNSFSWTDTIDLNNPTTVFNPMVVTGNVFNSLYPYDVNVFNGVKNNAQNGDMLWMFDTIGPLATGGHIWVPSICGGSNYSPSYHPPAVVNIIPVSPNDNTLASGVPDQILIMNPNVQTGLCWTNTIDCGILSGIVSGTSGISATPGTVLTYTAQDGDILAYDINSGNCLGWLTSIDLNTNTYTFSNIMYGIGFTNTPPNGNQGNLLSTMFINAGGTTRGILSWTTSPEINPRPDLPPFTSQIVSSSVDLAATILPLSAHSIDACSISAMVVLDSSAAGGAKWTNTIDLNATGTVTRGYSL